MERKYGHNSLYQLKESASLDKFWVLHVLISFPFSYKTWYLGAAALGRIEPCIHAHSSGCSLFSATGWLAWNNPYTPVLLFAEMQWVPLGLLRTSLVAPAVEIHSPDYLFLVAKPPDFVTFIPNTGLWWPTDPPLSFKFWIFCMSDAGYEETQVLVLHQAHVLRDLPPPLLSYHLDATSHEHWGERGSSPKGIEDFAVCTRCGTLLMVLVVSTRPSAICPLAHLFSFLPHLQPQKFSSFPRKVGTSFIS